MMGANFMHTDLSVIGGWSGIDWTGAWYNDNTSFPNGMNPVDLGMINMSHGACCVSTGCFVIEEVARTSLGGALIGNATCESCVAIPAGGCCVGNSCSVLTEAQCSELTGAWLGEGGSCNDCVTPPTSCASDLNGDGEIAIDDLLILIGAWGMCP